MDSRQINFSELLNKSLKNDHIAWDWLLRLIRTNQLPEKQKNEIIKLSDMPVEENDITFTQSMMWVMRAAIEMTKVNAQDKQTFIPTFSDTTKNIKDYLTAIHFLMPAVKHKNVHGFILLSCLDQAIKPNLISDTEFTYLDLAIMDNQPEGMFVKGYLLEEQQKYTEAANYYRKAIAFNHAKAKCKLALLMINNHVQSDNLDEPIYLLREAVEGIDVDLKIMMQDHIASVGPFPSKYLADFDRCYQLAFIANRSHFIPQELHTHLPYQVKKIAEAIIKDKHFSDTMRNAYFFSFAHACLQQGIPVFAEINKNSVSANTRQYIGSFYAMNPELMPNDNLSDIIAVLSLSPSTSPSHMECCCLMSKLIYDAILDKQIEIDQLPSLIETFINSSEYFIKKARKEYQYYEGKLGLLLYQHQEIRKWQEYIDQFATIAKQLLAQMKTEISQTSWRVSNSIWLWTENLPDGVKEIKTILDKISLDNKRSVFQSALKIRKILEDKIGMSWTIANLFKNNLTRDEVTLAFYQKHFSLLPAFSWDKKIDALVGDVNRVMRVSV